MDRSVPAPWSKYPRGDYGTKQDLTGTDRGRVLLRMGINFDLSRMSTDKYMNKPFVFLLCKKCKGMAYVTDGNWRRVYYPLRETYSYIGKCPGCNEETEQEEWLVEMINGLMSVPTFSQTRGMIKKLVQDEKSTATKASA